MIDKSDYQLHVERQMRYEGEVAVASTDSNETTYIWHNGDEYRGVTRTYTNQHGYHYDGDYHFDSDDRKFIFDHYNVASVGIDEAPEGVKRAASRETPDENL